MASQHESTILKSIHTLFNAGTTAGLTDSQLLERIESGPGAMAEAAFEALLSRHGGMVWAVCRNVLRDGNDADDAFQASFLVLLRKAKSIRKRSTLGPWLHGVAYRIAVRAKSQANRRRSRENGGVERLAEVTAEIASFDDLAMLHEEVTRLPEKYRKPVILCYLEGCTSDDVARQLGWPVGTVSGRLARAKALLRSRLIQRGLAPSAALFGVALAGRSVRAAIPKRLVEKTVSALLGNPTQGPLVGATVTGSVASLAHCTLHTLSVAQSKWAAAILLAGVTVATGAAMEWQDVKGDAAGSAQAQATTRKEPLDAVPAPSANTPRTVTANVSNQDPLMEIARAELAAIEARLKAKEFALQKADAQLELAQAVLARALRLQGRGKAFIPKEEVQKNEAEVKVAVAERDGARAELEEIQLRVNQAKRIIDHPELVGPWLQHANQSSSVSALENRLKNVERQLDRLRQVEQKLDQILKIIVKTSEKP